MLCTEPVIARKATADEAISEIAALHFGSARNDNTEGVIARKATADEAISK
ncbi:hypothetical protein [Thermoclostridium caenicola]|uniref:hypothetical protein n=1 Tax=Thermoclostridium caenicola TaxID=659425 RepID=UPI00165ECDDE|nr:hypothetical protein [Thermoclostridium caenicola]